jgi:hypothetical protein
MSLDAGRIYLAQALRLGEAFHLWMRSVEEHPWTWLPSITQHWLAIVSAYSLPPWTGGSPDYRTHPDLAAQSWGLWLVAFAAELESAGNVAAHEVQESNEATIARYTSKAFDHYGLPAGSWDLLRSSMMANQAVAPIELDDDSETTRWAWFAWHAGFEVDFSGDNPSDYPGTYERDDLGPFDDPQWDERQCWAAVAALVLAAHDLGQATMRTAARAAPALTHMPDFTVPAAAEPQAEPAAHAAPLAVKSKLPQAVAIVGGTGLALVLLWILLA